MPGHIRTGFMNTLRRYPGPWPWYAYILIGIAFSGLFPWLMLSRALYERHRIRESILALAINVPLFTVLTWFSLRSVSPWWVLLSGMYGFNIVWSVIAWSVQLKAIGPCRKRYRLREWRSWITPVVIGGVLGVCIALFIYLPSVFETRTALHQQWDPIARKTIIWDLFSRSLIGLWFGMIVGLWWAGQRRRFSSGSIISFLSAFIITSLSWLGLTILTLTLVYKGGGLGNYSHGWSLVPPWVNGFKQHLILLGTFDISSIMILPLFFNDLTRIRDFGKRLSLVPLAFICSMPLIFASNQWWESTQGQIFYEMNSPDVSQKASAYKWCDIMLKRYPQHQQWPRLAEMLAQHLYDTGDYEGAKGLYKKILNTCEGSIKWHWVFDRARCAIESPGFAMPDQEVHTKIPMIDYEEYLCPNWMALLSIIRYWEGEDKPESAIKIRLKDLSVSRDSIDLIPLDSLAGLDDAARSLGYEVILVPAHLDTAKTLLKKGIPVIHVSYGSFKLLYAFDDSRSTVKSYSFRNLSTRLKRSERKEAREILSIEDEGKGQSRQRLIRIANEAYNESSYTFWKADSIRFHGPLIAVVCRPEKAGKVASALGKPLNRLRRQSKGYLASLIGFSYLQYADYISSIEWSKRASEKIFDPLPLFIAHLSDLSWKSRSRLPKSAIPLERHLPDLKEVGTYFSRHENKVFLKEAQKSFDKHCSAGDIPWFLIDIYISLLESSDPAGLGMKIKTLEACLKKNPLLSDYRRALVNALELTGDNRRMIEALNGIVGLNPYDFRSKLHLAYAHITLDQYAQAETVLEKTDEQDLTYDANYRFCLGALAEYKGKPQYALIKYKEAIEMRRYSPLYHLRYGRLLLDLGRNEEAKKALSWASRIDAAGQVKKDADNLLTSMEQRP